MFFRDHIIQVRLIKEKKKKKAIKFGRAGDTNLYRSTSEPLKTDVNLWKGDDGIYRNPDGTPFEFKIPEEPKPVDHYALATVTAERVIESGIFLIGVYFAADTLRQVAIHTAQVKIK